MGYLNEFRLHWRALVSAALGLACGTSLNISTVSFFAPALIHDFGWSKAEYALVGTLALPLMILVPIIGYLTDMFGVKRVATVGLVAMPLTHLAFTFLTGNITVYFTLYFLQICLGATTTAMVYSRIVALRFEAARGLALAIVASGGAVLLAVLGPALGTLIDHHGWRPGYQALAAFAAICSLIVWLLMPDDDPRRTEVVAAPSSRRDYARVLGSRPFWVIGVGMWFCYMLHSLLVSQFKLMLLEKGLTSATATWVISLFSLTVVAGRFLCGLALDRFPTHIVAVVGMGLPAIGLFVLASPIHGVPILVVAVLIMGLSQGAEIDLLTYLVSRYFARSIYGTVVSLIYSGMTLAAALGALILSLTLEMTGHYFLYMNLMGVLTLAGASLFYLLGNTSALAAEAERPPLPAT